MRLQSWMLTTAVLLAGCAGLTARKVPLESRLNQCDDNVRGFRYYLSRPYLVVSKQVSLGSEIKVGTLGQFRGDDKTLILACPTTSGETEYFLTNGQPFQRAEGTFVPLRKAPPDAGGGAGGAPGTGGAGQPAGSPAGTGINRPSLAPAVHSASIHRSGAQQLSARRTAHEGADTESLQEPQLAQVDTMFPSDPILRLPNYGGVTTLAQLSVESDTTPPNPKSLSIVMLPDFAEQMALDDSNCAAYSTYSLRFHNGWQLTTVNGSFDATAVPVDILKVLGTALQGAQDTKLAQLKAQAPTTPPASASDVGFMVDTTVVRAVLIKREYIAPGMYKLLKAEEQNAGQASQFGYFSDLGIPSHYEVNVKLLSAE